MSIYKLTLIIKHATNEDEFLIVKQHRPPKFGDEEYDFYIDSDLWDLPSVQLVPLECELRSEIEVEGAEFYIDKFDLRKFDLRSAVDQVFEQVGFGGLGEVRWKFLKYVNEPEFGPGPPIQTIFLTGRLELSCTKNEEALCRWITKENCLSWLWEVKKGSDRMGSLVVDGIFNDSLQSTKWNLPQNLRCQEYPPGVTLVPMASRTQKPFKTTNLAVIAPHYSLRKAGEETYVATGDALVVDPGCHSEFHQELAGIISALPRKLIVFVTHHHHDHVDGLSVIQKCNPEAVLLAHENTMRRVGRGTWSLGYISVAGNEQIYVGGQKLRVIFAPGHTDGHTALLHVSTHSLIAGDHCVGQGSAVLDATSGGNMAEYFNTTHNFLELSPHVLIPMHGRVNVWPKHMLSGYLKNRKARESSVLKAIENGARTLFDIVAAVYSDVDRSLWIPAASNVKLHVEHLALQQKLPEDPSIGVIRPLDEMMCLMYESCNVLIFDPSKLKQYWYSFSMGQQNRNYSSHQVILAVVETIRSWRMEMVNLQLDMPIGNLFISPSSRPHSDWKWIWALDVAPRIPWFILEHGCYS